MRQEPPRTTRNGFVDEEQSDTPILLIQEGSADRQLALCPQPIRVCKMGRAGASDPVQVSVLEEVDELHGALMTILISAPSGVVAHGYSHFLRNSYAALPIHCRLSTS